jgi:hypothetical protein
VTVMRSANELPPMPDRHTGEPRPPAAPITKSSDEQPKPWHARKVPQPPEHEGPPLEWKYTDGNDKRWTFGVTVVLVIGFLIIRGALSPDSTAFGWIVHWQVWAALAVGGLFMVWLGTGAMHMSAGADWFMQDKAFVKTYQLTSITMKKSWAKEGDLVLKDRHGRYASSDFGTIRSHEALWDLVYNGILHSVAAGADVDKMAVQRLRLYDALAIHEQNQSKPE